MTADPPASCCLVPEPRPASPGAWDLGITEEGGACSGLAWGMRGWRVPAEQRSCSVPSTPEHSGSCRVPGAVFSAPLCWLGERIPHFPSRNGRTSSKVLIVAEVDYVRKSIESPASEAQGLCVHQGLPVPFPARAHAQLPAGPPVWGLWEAAGPWVSPIMDVSLSFSLLL